MDYFNALEEHYAQVAARPEVILAFSVGVVVSASFLLIVNSGKPKPVLDPTKFQNFPLMEKKELSSNTARYRFRLPKKNSMLGLPIGQHISVQADVNGKMVQRSYTPTTSDDELGFFDLVIKTYPQGNVSAFVGSMKIGDTLSVKGPKGAMRYQNGIAKEIGLLGGGTGLTPLLQIITQVLKDPEDHTQLRFIYANVKPEDILLKEDLDRLAAEHDQFQVQYFVNEAPKGWKGGEGFVTKEAIEEFLPAASQDSKILMCGPPPFINACKGHLDALGFDKPRPMSKMEDQVFCF